MGFINILSIVHIENKHLFHVINEKKSLQITQVSKYINFSTTFINQPFVLFFW